MGINAGFLVLLADGTSRNVTIVSEHEDEQTARLVATDPTVTRHLARHKTLVAVKVLSTFTREGETVTQAPESVIPRTSENARKDVASSNTPVLQGTPIHMACATDTGEGDAKSADIGGLNASSVPAAPPAIVEGDDDNG